MTRNLSVWVSLVCALAGVGFYSAITFEIFFSPAYPHFGSDIYDAYFYRIKEGRFDLPARLLRYEGHYTNDGTGFLYHGIAPLLTRIILAPFVALNNFPSGPFSIWLWTILGTGIYHLTLFQVVQKFSVGIEGYKKKFWAILVGLSIWFGGPGVFLSANVSLYHEPICITYAATALSIFLMMRCIFFDLPFNRILIILAILAGVTLHARPHVAVGLYAGVILAGGHSLWKGSERRVAPVVVSILLLFTFGGAFLGLNNARFGSPMEIHGHFDGQPEKHSVQYGPVFWRFEDADSARARTFVEHGRFNVRRILPNLGLYIFALPSSLVGDGVSEHMDKMHALATRKASGFGRVEGPRIGVLMLWPVWFALAATGWFLKKPNIPPLWAALPIVSATCLTAALLTSYPTITLRYRAELWPFLIVICLLFLPNLVQNYGCRRWVLISGFVILVPGILASTLTAKAYTIYFQTVPGTLFGTWGSKGCAELVRGKDLPENSIARICIDPNVVYPRNTRG